MRREFWICVKSYYYRKFTENEYLKMYINAFVGHERTVSTKPECKKSHTL